MCFVCIGTCHSAEGIVALLTAYVHGEIIRLVITYVGRQLRYCILYITPTRAVAAIKARPRAIS